jgi:hypothetical protein
MVVVAVLLMMLVQDNLVDLVVVQELQIMILAVQLSRPLMVFHQQFKVSLVVPHFHMLEVMACQVVVAVPAVLVKQEILQLQVQEKQVTVVMVPHVLPIGSFRQLMEHQDQILEDISLVAAVVVLGATLLVPVVLAAVVLVEHPVMDGTEVMLIQEQ